MPTHSTFPAELNVIAGPGRFRGEARVVLTNGRGARAHGLWARARPGLRAWVDLYDVDLDLLERSPTRSVPGRQS